MEQDHYKVLGVAENADEDTIKKAYRELAKKYHPDIAPSKEAEEKMKEAGEAYAVLSDQAKRKAYDETRKSKVGGQNTNSAVNDFVNQVVDDFVNSFQSYFYGRSSSSQNRSEQKAEEPEEPKEIDFSEIAEIDRQIKEYNKVMQNLMLEQSQIESEIWKEDYNIFVAVEELRKSKIKEEGFQKASKYIEKFKKRDCNRILSLTITQKQYDLYRSCVELVEKLEKELKNVEETLKKEKIEPLQKQKEKKDEEYWNIHRKKSSLESKYYNHPLKYKYEYEYFKKEQEKIESDKRAI